MAEDGVLFPRFFKVFLSATSSDSLVIPLSFMEYLDDPLPKTVKLQGIGGGFWTVNLTRICEAVYFTGGWPKFAEDHELKDGEFLTFVYDGNRTFEVSVFGRSGCKETRAVTLALQLSDSDSVEEEEEEEDKETLMDVDDDDNSFCEDEAASQVVAGNPNIEALTNPHFPTTLKNRNYELLIPANTVKDYCLTFGDSIKYIDEEGTIEGERAKFGDARIAFKGWDKICRRNRLKKQEDTVECELLHDQNHVHSIRVHVIRGSV